MHNMNLGSSCLGQSYALDSDAQVGRERVCRRRSRLQHVHMPCSADLDREELIYRTSWAAMPINHRTCEHARPSRPSWPGSGPASRTGNIGKARRASRKEFSTNSMHADKHRTQSVDAALSDTLLPEFPSAGSHMSGIATVKSFHLSCVLLVLAGVSLAYRSVNPAVVLALPTCRGSQQV